tara:strand:- start:790 stop:1005 length:216 start_codon:yes stop_codon:yes gene_type:complete
MNKIDLDQIRKLKIQPNAVLLIPVGTDVETMQELSQALRKVQPRGNVLLVNGLDLQQLDEQDMNAAGWYRK